MPLPVPTSGLAKIGSFVGFVAAVLGIGEWTGYFPGWGPKETVQTVQVSPTAPVISHPPGSDEERIAQMIARSVHCEDLSLDIVSLGRRDTAAEDSTSGQPGTYLEASLHAKQAGTPADFQAIGTGRGPAAEGQAFTALLGAIKDRISETYAECREG